MDLSDDFVDICEADDSAMKTDIGSVEIISYGQYFSPFKSEMHREVFEHVVFFKIKL
ncbi:hypothetical protein Hanom_Chr08g00701721 [Helianthus anomalus]